MSPTPLSLPASLLPALPVSLPASLLPTLPVSLAGAGAFPALYCTANNGGWEEVARGLGQAWRHLTANKGAGGGGMWTWSGPGATGCKDLDRADLFVWGGAPGHRRGGWGGIVLGPGLTAKRQTSGWRRRVEGSCMRESWRRGGKKKGGREW